MSGNTSGLVAARSASRELAAYAAGLRYEAIPAEVVGKAKRCVLDTLGCMLFGATLPWTRIVADMAREEGGAPQAACSGSTPIACSTRSASSARWARGSSPTSEPERQGERRKEEGGSKPR